MNRSLQPVVPVTAGQLATRWNISVRAVQQITDLHGKWFKVPGIRAAVIDESDVAEFLTECKEKRAV